MVFRVAELKLHSHHREVVTRPLVLLMCLGDVLLTSLRAAAALSNRPAAHEFPFLLCTDMHICIDSCWHEQ